MRYLSLGGTRTADRPHIRDSLVRGWGGGAGKPAHVAHARRSAHAQGCAPSCRPLCGVCDGVCVRSCEGCVLTARFFLPGETQQVGPQICPAWSLSVRACEGEPAGFGRVRRCDLWPLRRKVLEVVVLLATGVTATIALVLVAGKGGRWAVEVRGVR